VKLGEVLKKWRGWSELTVRDVAKDMGIAASTLCRIENGEMMDGRTLAAIMQWLFREGERK